MWKVLTPICRADLRMNYSSSDIDMRKRIHRIALGYNISNLVAGRYTLVGRSAFLSDRNMNPVIRFQPYRIVQILEMHLANLVEWWTERA